MFVNTTFLLLILCVFGTEADICNVKVENDSKSEPVLAVYTINNITNSYFANNSSYNAKKSLDLLKTWSLYSQPFSLNLQDVSEGCQNGFKSLEYGLKNLEIWAMKMSDATAKLQSGILSGNVNQYGHFDQCLEIEEAQYCLAEIDFNSNWNKNLDHIKNLVHSYYPLRGNFKDPAHRVPSFSTIKWGLCLPKECTNLDIEKSLKRTLGVDVYMRASLCQTANIKPKTFGDGIARIFFVTLALTIFLATFYSWFYQENTNKRKSIKLLKAFSLIENWKNMTIITEDGLKSVDGIRGLAALGLLISHKYMALLYNPYINRTYMAKTMTMSWSVFGRTAILYTDAFILISALLSTRSILQDLEKYNSMKFAKKLLNRMFRISPNLIAVILFCTYILPNLGSGPMWPIVINHHSELCKNHMWRNMLYIHNYFGFENMCLTHSHQVAIDMQLFLTLPLFIFLLWKNKKVGMMLLIALAVLSTILRFAVTYTTGISHLIYFGITISKMFDTANLSYILPTHRATIYIFGIILAVILQKNYKFPKTKLQATILWVTCFPLGLISLIGPIHAANPNYKHNNLESAIFGAFSPIFCGIAIAWVIYASNNNYAGFLGDFLSWKGFKLFSKISYSVYLTQFPVFFYNVGIRRYAEQYSPFLMFQIPETLVIILVSTVLTLCVEMPFINISKILLNNEKRSKKDEKVK